MLFNWLPHSNYMFFAVILITCQTLVSCEEMNEMAKAESDAMIREVYNYEGKAVKVGVIGLVHTHVHWILGREKFGDIEIVGIVEPNKQLAKQYSEQHGYSMDIVFDSMDEMISEVNPEAVTAFNTIFDHLSVVEYCAPRGIHVLVEKPLSVNWDHAVQMEDLAKKHNIHLLTNYETSWYGSNWDAYQMIHDEEKIGPIRKIVFNTGHPGPIEIGCNDEFLEWLTDPVLNGGGALTDFGCYGANLATWLMEGKTPVAVTCITQQIKPDKYPMVEDDATILIEYLETQVVIQASWNWSHNRKDMQVYGASGYINCKNSMDMEVLFDEDEGPFQLTAKSLSMGIHDPFAYLNQVINGNHKVSEFEPSSLENNMIVMQILEAAKYSAETGKRIIWEELF